MAEYPVTVAGGCFQCPACGADDTRLSCCDGQGSPDVLVFILGPDNDTCQCFGIGAGIAWDADLNAYHISGNSGCGPMGGLVPYDLYIYCVPTEDGGTFYCEIVCDGSTIVVMEMADAGGSTWEGHGTSLFVEECPACEEGSDFSVLVTPTGEGQPNLCEGTGPP